MINKKLYKLVRNIVLALIVLILFFSGYYLGEGIATKKIAKQQNTATSDKKVKNGEEETITIEKVKEFLVLYFTKKDLGENRERYRPFVTEGLFNAFVSEEEKSSNKAYQGYIVDYEFENAEIFINEYKKEALVTVNYKNSSLAIKDDRTKATTKSYKESYILTYTKKEGKHVVNSMDRVTIDKVEERRNIFGY